MYANNYKKRELNLKKTIEIVENNIEAIINIWDDADNEFKLIFEQTQVF